VSLYFCILIRFKTEVWFKTKVFPWKSSHPVSEQLVCVRGCSMVSATAIVGCSCSLPESYSVIEFSTV